MSCSKCCGFKPFFGKVDYVIRDYPPKGDFSSYTVPTIYIDANSETGYLLISKKNGQSKWLSFCVSTSGIKKIITKCGDILPINGSIIISNGEGIILSCKNEELKFSLDIPIKSNLGGTGYTEYKLGDLLVGDKDGFLQKLAAGKIGQVLGVKEDGTIGYITSSVTAPIQKFTVSPCGELTPNKDGLIGLELSKDFVCELNEEKNKAKINIKAISNNIKGLCLDNTLLYTEGLLDPICIGPDENGLVNFEAGSNIDLAAIKNGVRISSTGGSGGDPNLVIISDKSTISRVAQDKTIYIINMKNPVKARLNLPAKTRLGFWFACIGIRGGFEIGTTTESNTQYLKFKDQEVTTYLVSGADYTDCIILCYEENVRYKWLFQD